MSDRTGASDTTLTPDLCIIGGGTAGLALAQAAAAFGVPVVLIERDRLGGRRLHGGGIAALALTELARRRVATGASAAPDAGSIRAQVMQSARVLASNASAERLGALGITLIAGEARFLNRRLVEAGGRTIRARRIVIATGSQPALPYCPGLADLPYALPAEAAALAAAPGRVIVLGGDGDAAVLAQALQRLGSTVTLVAPDGLLTSFDGEAAGLLRRQLLRDGISLHERANGLRAQAAGDGVRLVITGAGDSGETAIEADRVLIATRRAPAVAGLALDLAGIAADENGIAVGRDLRTGNRRVFAIGSCAATPGEAPGSGEHQAGLVLRNILFRLPVRHEATASARVVVAAAPEVASTGLDEAQARAQGPIRVLRWPYAENDRAAAEGASEGLVKVITDRRGRVLGASIAGARAGELIAPWCLAVGRKMPITQMAGLVLPPTTLSEMSRRAALSFYAPLAASPRLRRLIGFLRRFG